MSKKTTLKKLLSTMEKDQLIKLILQLYSARKEAQEYLDYFTEPDEKAKLEEYKKIIREEFYPKGNTFNPKLRLSVCRKVISNFKKLSPSPEALADLLLYYPECALEFAYEYGVDSEQFAYSAETNFEKAASYIAKSDLWEKFEHRLRQCVTWADPLGYFLGYNIDCIYDEYAPSAEEEEEEKD